MANVFSVYCSYQLMMVARRRRRRKSEFEQVLHNKQNSLNSFFHKQVFFPQTLGSSNALISCKTLHSGPVKSAASLSNDSFS